MSPRRRLWASLAGVSVAALVIILLLALAGRAVLNRAQCANPLVIRMAAAVEIAPAAQQIAAGFNNLDRDVSGHCAMVEVTEQEPAAVVAQLSGEATSSGEPVDAWIPDSSLWLDLVRGSGRGATALRATGVSVASSPLVIAMPRQLAARVLGPSGSGASWKLLFPPADGGPPASLGLRAQLPDPTASAAGLAALVAVRRQLGTSRQGRDQLADVVTNMLSSATFTGAQAMSSFATLAAPPWNQRLVTVTTEQAVESYNQANPGQPLAAVYPAGGTFSMDYPYLVATSSPVRTQVAEEFGQFLRSSQVKSAVTRLLFRAADGQPGPGGGKLGADPAMPRKLAGAGPGEAAETEQAWRRLRVAIRQLLLVDVSGAMGQPFAGQGLTPVQLMTQDTSLGMGLLPDNTEMGMWQYASDLRGGQPYQVVVPVGPLPGQVGLITRRQQFIQIGQTVHAMPGKSAALYSSVLAAFRYLNATYQPGYLNELLVVGSGTETAPGDISLSQLLARLRRVYNPQHRVVIITVTFGTAGNTSALRQITGITHGASYTIHQPSDIVSVFLDTAGNQVCAPNCGH